MHLFMDNPTYLLYFKLNEVHRLAFDSLGSNRSSTYQEQAYISKCLMQYIVTIQASFNLVHRKNTGFRIHIKIATIVLFMPLVHMKYMDSIAKFPLYAILEKIVGNLACVWF
jgi:hypothetical protein